MNDYLESYYFEIETIAPIHIGSGDKIIKKDYLVDRKNGRVLFFDEKKMMKYLMTHSLLEDYMNHKKSLASFFYEKSIYYKEYSEWIKYSVDLADKKIAQENVRDVSVSMKDVYGNPYIPGSTFKGYLRTALLLLELGNNKALASKYSSKVESVRRFSRNDSSLSREIEMEVFNKKRPDDNVTKVSDMVNSVLKGLIVGDSEPIEPSNLIFCQKVDVAESSLGGTIGSRANKMPFMREAIRSGVVIRIPITIDHSVCPYTKDDLKRAIEYMSSLYKAYRDEFLEDRESSGRYAIYLGGGTGFNTKAVTSYLFKNKDKSYKLVAKIIDDTTRSIHHHINSLGRGKNRAEPRVLKCTYENGKLKHMGECKLVKIIKRKSFQPIG